MLKFCLCFLQDVDYEGAMAAKLSIAKKIYSKEKGTVLSSPEFQNYLSENQVTISLLAPTYLVGFLYTKFSFSRVIGMVETLCSLLFPSRLFRNIRSQSVGAFFCFH